MCLVLPQREHGHHAVETVEAMHAGTAKVFTGLGGNFIRAISDTDRSYDAMRKLELTVGITTKLNRGHLVHGKSMDFIWTFLLAGVSKTSPCWIIRCRAAQLQAIIRNSTRFCRLIIMTASVGRPQ